MPTRAKRICRQPGCGCVVASGYCRRHKQSADKDRPNAQQRGYGRTWQKASRAFLMDHQLCAGCEQNGIIKAADCVDHITPHRGNDELFWDRGNWQPLCNRCHGRKTAAGL